MSSDGSGLQTASIGPEAEYPASFGICYLRFWYYLHSNLLGPADERMGKLSVFMQGKSRDISSMMLAML